jgi:hypothetical protein
MTIDFSYLVPLAIIGFIGLVVGVLAGFLVAGLRAASRTTRPMRNRDLVEVMRIWHDRRSKELSIEIGGKIYKKATDLNEKSHRGFVALLNELQIWLGIPDLDQRLGEVVSRPTPVIEQPSPKTTLGVSDGVVKAPPSTIATVPMAQLAENEVEFQSPVVRQEIPITTPIKVEVPVVRRNIFVLGKTKEPPKETPKELKSIAVQVDEILQEKLAGSPDKIHVIRLLELPGKGVAVLVDNTQYEGVGEVPDPEVRQVIQESVAEWERRMSVK